MNEKSDQMKPKKTLSRLALAFFLNLGFSVFEVIGGFYTNSVAILSDSIHDLGDSVSIGISWLMDIKARKKPTKSYTYGYSRYSLLGALISSLILLVGSTIMVIEAIQRLANPEPVRATEMIWFAVIGIVINGWAALHASKGKSINEKAVGLHLFEDVFGWVAVLLGSIAMTIWEIPILDSLLSIGFTIFIMTHVVKNIRSIIEVFLEKAPGHIDIEKVQADLLSVEGILDVHHVHVWSLEGQIPLITLHIVLKKGVNEEQYQQIQKTLHERLHEAGLEHATIELEYDPQVCEEADFEKEGYCPETEEHHHH